MKIIEYGVRGKEILAGNVSNIYFGLVWFLGIFWRLLRKCRLCNCLLLNYSLYVGEEGCDPQPDEYGEGIPGQLLQEDGLQAPQVGRYKY